MLFNLNWYDYGFRNYDPQIGRFPQLDPLTDDYPELTPYQYASNDPIANIDLDGLEGVTSIKTLSNVTVQGFIKAGTKVGISAGIRIGTNLAINSAQIMSVHSEQSAVSKNLQQSLTNYQIVNSTPKGARLDRLRKEAVAEVENEQHIDELVRVGLWDRSLTEDQAGRNFINLFLGVTIPNVAIRPIAVATGSRQMTTVGRWMSKSEYAAMKNGGRVIEGAGGKTSVSIGGSNSFTGASKGSIYVEFQVPTNSLVQGGQSNWYSIIGPNANNVMKAALQKQGGVMLPKFENLSPILKTK